MCHEALEAPHWHVDHIVALHHGGDHSEGNLRILCIRCHKWKSIQEQRYGLSWNFVDD